MLDDDHLVQLKIAKYFLKRLLPFLRWFESDKPRAPFVADKLTEVHRALGTPPSLADMIALLHPVSLTPSLEQLIGQVHLRSFEKWMKHFNLIINDDDPANVELVRFWHVAKIFNPSKKGARLIPEEEAIEVMLSFAPANSPPQFGFLPSSLCLCLLSYS